MAFLEDFENAGASEEALEDRTGWTLVTDGTYKGLADDVDDIFLSRATGGGSGDTVYTCTNQGSADHYTQAKLGALSNSNNSLYFCTRLQDIDNYVALYLAGTGSVGFRMAKVVSGVLTDLVSMQGVTLSTYKVEADGTSFELFEDDVSQGNDTVSGMTSQNQGIVIAGAKSAADWDDFEAGALAAPPAGQPLAAFLPTMQHCIRTPIQ